MRGKRERLLREMYAAMHARLGPSGWWPGETPLEICVGAVLTQNTAWTNVEKAIHRLREAGALADGQTLLALPEAELSELIRPAGFFRLKAVRLRNLLRFLDDACGFDFGVLARQELHDLRPRLLGVSGIGPETADSVLLYAVGLPTFVVDAYTRRILHRHAMVPEDIPYHDLRDVFMDVLDPDVDFYNEYHALIVRVAKDWCRARAPRCADCPLCSFLDGGVA